MTVEINVDYCRHRQITVEITIACCRNYHRLLHDVQIAADIDYFRLLCVLETTRGEQRGMERSV